MVRVGAPIFDELTQARIEAWFELDEVRKTTLGILQNHRLGVERQLDDPSRKGDPACPSETAAVAGALRQVIGNMEKLRTAVISTPVDGTDVSSKFANAVASGARAFTIDDLVNSIPERDMAHDFSAAITVLQLMLEHGLPSRQPALLREISAQIASKLKWLATPRGGRETTEDLRKLRDLTADDLDMEELLGGLEI